MPKISKTKIKAAKLVTFGMSSSEIEKLIAAYGIGPSTTVLRVALSEQLEYEARHEIELAEEIERLKARGGIK